MEALLTLNIFTMSLPAAWLGMGLFGGLIVWPLWLARDLRRGHHPAAVRGRAD